ncbi:hypothetical protein ACOJUR_12285 [Alicyclobacillus tolerans]|uniref:hypothetical protein n=1 Tax=Alicyclobacillus tolerans TaxID=90970 RepID=UPI003B7F794C
MSLERLIQIARERGDKIAAVNDGQTAYCPTTGILFPDRQDAKERLRDALASLGCPKSMRGEITNELTEHFDEYTDLDVLSEHSFYSTWVCEDGTVCSSDEVGMEGGRCSEFGIYYTDLDLPEDVRPEHDPFELQAELKGLKPEK